MESQVVTACVIIAVLGVISAAFGFAAEGTRVKVSQIYIEDYSACVYPSSPALGLGVAAAVFAVAVRITIAVYAGCCTCCQSDPYASPMSRLLFIFSWIASVIAVIILLVAAGLNNRQGGEEDTDGGLIKCNTVNPGVFATGAALSFVSAFLGIAAILTVNSARQAGMAAGNIPMGMYPPGAATNIPMGMYPPVAATNIPMGMYPPVAATNIPMGMHPPVTAANYYIDPEKRPVRQQYYN